MPQQHLANQLDDLDAGDLARLAADQFNAGAETGRTGQLTAAAADALVSIAASLDRHAPDLTTLRPARDDR